jgi:cyclopropane fatty-acyl-phospholipid synthase-like methyltransferase
MQRQRPRICPFPELLAHVPPGARVLEAGCGAGSFVLQAAARGDGVTGLGFDADPAAVAMAQRVAARAGLDGVRFEHREAAGGWPDGAWDVVALIDLLHHVTPAAREGVITAAANCVAPGGILLYKDMCRRPRWRAAMNQLHDVLVAQQWVHHADPVEVERWAAAAGLRLRHAERLNRWWYGHDLRIFARPSDG